MGSRRLEAETTAEAYLELLKDRGIDVFLGNAGTDFASLVEAFARFETESGRAPRPLVVPHEFVAVSMAHGYYAAGGRPAAVMVHVNVGTGNASTAIITASRANIPILMSAGRTPITEGGLPGARDLHIHWAQESFDQAAMLREYVKWDYELRTPVQIESVVDRAFELMLAEPRGPVYLTLPREVLAAPPGAMTITSPPRRQSRSERFPDPARIDEAARILARAEHAIILTSAAGIDARAGAGAPAARGGRAASRRSAGGGPPSRAHRRRASQASGGVGRDGAEAGERADDRLRVGVAVHRRARRREHGGRERVPAGPAVRRVHATGQLLRVAALERTRLPPGRSTRREAPPSPGDGHRHPGGRRLLLPRAAVLPLCAARPPPADPHRRLQQPAVGGREVRGAGRPRRRRRQDARPFPAERAHPFAALRGDGEDRGRLR